MERSPDSARPEPPLAYRRPSQGYLTGPDRGTPVTAGNNNIAVGETAGLLLTSGDENIYLGNQGASTESGTMRLGGANQIRTFIAGIANTPLSGTMVLIDGSGQLGITLSSARYKRDIQALGGRSRGLLKLRPVTFHYRQDPQRLRQGCRTYGCPARGARPVTSSSILGRKGLSWIIWRRLGTEVRRMGRSTGR